MITQSQEFTPSLEWLFSRGWNVREAAERLNVSPGHLSRVLKGERSSIRIHRELTKLPQKKLVLRRRLKLIRG